MRRAAIVLSLIVGSAVAVGEQASCSRNAFGVFEDLNCAVEAMQSADRELNQTYTLLLSKLGARDATQLRQSQRAWLKFLDADTQLALQLEGDGSAGRLVVANLREKHMRLRVGDLKNWISR